MSIILDDSLRLLVTLTLILSTLVVFEVTVDALREIAEQLGKRDWNFSQNPCDGNSSWATLPRIEMPLYVNILNCSCSFPGNVCHVVSLSLKGQDLDGVLPPSLRKLTYIKNIDLSRNYLSGTIPPEWSSIRAINLSVMVNRLSGRIPTYLGDITSLVYLGLENNMFSGPVPAEIGKLTNLSVLVLSSNNLTGNLPQELNFLTNLVELQLSSNNFRGKIPDLGKCTKLEKLMIQASGLEGPIPESFSFLINLKELRISDLTRVGSVFPNLSGMTKMKKLDLSFNKLNEIPADLSTLSKLQHLYLTGNSLDNNFPKWITDKVGNIVADLSYNNFSKNTVPQVCGQSLDIGNCLNIRPCLQSHYFVHINCGGPQVTIGNKTYEGDEDQGGPAKFNPSSDYWGYSSTGSIWSVKDNIANYTETNTSILTMNDYQLYTKARHSYLSLTYYGRCLANGNYTVTLHFAEIVFTDNTSYTSLGRRGVSQLKDFDIKFAAGGVAKKVNRTFNGIPVTNTTLEVRFQYAGKGTVAVPIRGVYGPLISAISMEADFKPPIVTHGKNYTFVIIGVVAALLCLVLTVLGILWKMGYLREQDSREKDLRGLDLQTGVFTYRQIKAATDKFAESNKLGEGGFGSVYMGTLLDGTPIAVKKLSSKSNQGNREFVNEIGMIAGIQHPNVVRLYGCCVEGNHLLLVYEYMQNNSLAHALFERENSKLEIDWPTRQRICVGIAKGLTFLHEDSVLRMVHRDIKATNVLLDADLTPKISDFGLAKLDEEENTHISTRVAGTIGYMAPEYALWGHLTYKADVYSFGVLALEIVAGKNNMKYRPTEDYYCLLDWAVVLKQKGSLMDLVDPRLGSEFNKKEAVRMIKIALLCTNKSPTLRPTMSEVVNMLEGRIKIKEPNVKVNMSEEELILKEIEPTFEEINNPHESDETEILLNQHISAHMTCIPIVNKSETMLGSDFDINSGAIAIGDSPLDSSQILLPCRCCKSPISATATDDSYSRFLGEPIEDGEGEVSRCGTLLIMKSNVCANRLRRVLGSDIVEMSCFEKAKLVMDISIPILMISKLAGDVGRLTDDLNCAVTFFPDFWAAQDLETKTLIGVGERRRGLYRMDSEVGTRKAMSAGPDVNAWHRRLGHASESKLHQIVFLKNFSYKLKNKTCDSCAKAKLTRLPFPTSSIKTVECFDLIHCDIWGGYRTPSFTGARYFLTVVDDYSRAVWVFLLKHKHEASTYLVDFCFMVKTQFNKAIKRIRSDNGGEFVSTEMQDFYATQGIVLETSCVKTPQQNGVVERKHRHLLEVARSLRFEAKLPIRFWGECILTATYIINRLPSKVIDYKTPFEILFKQQPDYSHMKVFGCLVYTRNTDTKGDKFEVRGRRGIFLGYPQGKKGYRVYDLESKKIVVSRDTKFVEDVFPYHDESSDSNTDLSTDPFIIDDVAEYTAPNDGSLPSNQPTVDEIPEIRDHDSSGGEEFTESQENDLREEVQKEKRVRFHPKNLRDFHVTLPPSIDNSLPTHTSTDHPISNYVAYANFSTNHKAFLTALQENDEPKYYKQAANDEKWREAMKKEIKALEDNDTWTLEDLPAGKRAIGSKWVYKVKYKPSGEVERYKARLVAKGFTQMEGVDFHDTFAPVAKLVTVRTLLAVATKKDWIIHQLDVNNAFLHGDLHEEVYMKIPEGFSKEGDTRVCRLRKSLYGLRQASRNWYQKFTMSLTRMGFVQSHADASLFIFNKGGVFVTALIYVDDVIKAGNDLSKIEHTKQHIDQQFSIKDLGTLKYFLGIEVARTAEGLVLSQRKYTLDILQDSGMEGCRPSKFPMEQNLQLDRCSSSPKIDASRYRRLVGRLLYLQATRPDIAYSVNMLSQFVEDPREPHMAAAYRVLRYLKTTPGQGILLARDGGLDLQAYCDSDWLGCAYTRRSRTGYLLLLGGTPISWKTKKQTVVSRSSAEAEYRAMAVTVSEILWIRWLLKILQAPQTKSTPLLCDNQAARHIANNPVFHERTKHVEMDCYFVRERVETKEIQPICVHTSLQIADIFTKALGADRLKTLLGKLGIRDLHAPA
ncbi:hypothetical protein LXL04_010646 [Taraxacum kok-saghyz]